MPTLLPAAASLSLAACMSWGNAEKFFWQYWCRPTTASASAMCSMAKAACRRTSWSSEDSRVAACALAMRAWDGVRCCFDVLSALPSPPDCKVAAAPSAADCNSTHQICPCWHFVCAEMMISRWLVMWQNTENRYCFARTCAVLCMATGVLRCQPLNTDVIACSSIVVSCHMYKQIAN